MTGAFLVLGFATIGALGFMGFGWFLSWWIDTNHQRPPKQKIMKKRTVKRRTMSKLNIPIRTIGVGGRYLAVANIGGITLTGPSSEDEVTAVQSLLWQMGPGAQLTQAPVAIALGLNNQTLADLANGDDIPKAIDGGDSAA